MKTIFTLLLLLAISMQLMAANYYVSTTGSNANNGSIGSPWLTVQYGLDQLNSGDVLLLATGTYNEKISIPTSGITLKNQPGQFPALDGTGLPEVPMIEIYDVSNITIDGIEIQNNVMNDAQGILVENDCQNITIQNCIIHDIHFSADPNEAATETKNAQGIIVYGTDQNNAITNLNILNNEMYDCRLGYSEGIAVNGNVDGFAVSGNLVHDLTNIGIDAIGHEKTSDDPANDQARNGLIKNNTVYNCLSPYATAGGIYVDGGKMIIIENNTCYHNGYGVEIGCENLNKTTSDITVRNNVLYDNKIAALALGGFDYPMKTGKVINSSFRNNTCYFNSYAGTGEGELYLSYFEGCTIENNIFYATNQNVAMYHTGTMPISSSINYNVYYSNNLSDGIEFTYSGNFYEGVSDFNTGTGFEANGQETNPLLVGPAIVAPNFHTQTSSPAINAGNPAFTPAASEVDLDGASRKIGINVDCGADEQATVLAVEYLQELEAVLKNNQVQLSWSTISESNSDRFEIERASDARNWVNIGSVAAKNNSSTLSLYTSIDTQPLTGVSYYRLKQIDFDGSFSYSNMVSTRFKQTTFSVYPNPTKGQLELSLSQNRNAKVIVTDVVGKILIQETFRSDYTQLDLSALPNGLYSVSVMAKGQLMNKKVLVQH